MWYLWYIEHVSGCWGELIISYTGFFIITTHIVAASCAFIFADRDSVLQWKVCTKLFDRKYCYYKICLVILYKCHSQGIFQKEFKKLIALNLFPCFFPQ